jgi:PEP-CTERM motif
MRDRRLLAISSVLLILLSAEAAFAGTVSLTFVGVSGQNGGGVYTFPYYFSIDNGPSTTLICDSYDNTINPPTQWTASVNNLRNAGNSGKGYFTGMQTQYDAAGLIFEAMLNGTVGTVQGNWAIWGLFSSNARNNSFYTSSGASNIESQYLTMAQNDVKNNSLPGYLGGMVIYTPVGGVGGRSGPQEFIGVTPEPTSLALFGSGLAVFGGVLRKKRSERPR